MAEQNTNQWDEIPAVSKQHMRKLKTRKALENGKNLNKNWETNTRAT